MIRHRETEKYYEGKGKWTSKTADAMPFDSLSEAAQEAQRSGLVGPCEYVVVVGGQIGFGVLLPA